MDSGLREVALLKTVESSDKSSDRRYSYNKAMKKATLLPVRNPDLFQENRL